MEAKNPDDREIQESLKDRLNKKYEKLTTTWTNDMPLEDLAEMVKFKCFLTRPEDAIAVKVIERLMVLDSAHKQICTVQFTLFQFKILYPHILYTESKAVGI